MRLFVRLAAGFAIAASVTTLVASAAEARKREPLRVTVQKRSYLDPGKVVPVGSLNRYATQGAIASPVYSASGELYGEGTLPPRIGSGANPFANSFALPRY
jgi:hypothetical protein